MLELHVWGPAFSLPSFDPQCLAAIAYMRLTVPAGSWTLIPSSNPLLPPGKTLPALRDGSSTWISSLNSIIAYLSQRHGPSGALASPTPHETALCAYITARGQELYDLSLFGSYKNYAAVTRPLLSTLLPWPVQYYLPPTLRSAAVSRISHLGVELELELSDTGDLAASGSAEEERVRSRTTTPLQSWLRGPYRAEATEHRLRGIVDEFFRVLREQLGDAKYLLGRASAQEDRAPSVADLLAVAYLAVFMDAEVPAGFVREGLRCQPRLCAYLHDLRPRFLGPRVGGVPSPGAGAAVGKGELPWGRVQKGDLPWLTGFLVERVKEGLVAVGRGAAEEDEEGEEDEDPFAAAQKKRAREMIRREWWKSVAVVGLGVGAFVGYIFWSGLLRFKFGDAEVKEAGDDNTDEEEEGEEEEEEEEEEGEGENDAEAKERSEGDDGKHPERQEWEQKPEFDIPQVKAEDLAKAMFA